MLILLRSSSLVLVIISRTSVPICNCFHARWGNISKITTFLRLLAQASLDLRGQDLDSYNTDNSVCSSVLGCARRDLNDLIWLIWLFIFSLVSVSCLLSVFVFFFADIEWWTKLHIIYTQCWKLHVGCLSLSPTISSHFTVEMCAAAKNCEKIQQNPLFGCSGSFKVIDVDKSKKPITSACYDVQQVCAYLQPFSCYTR